MGLFPWKCWDREFASYVPTIGLSGDSPSRISCHEICFKMCAVMTATVLAIKVDVDTDRGTREGVPALIKLFNEFDINATFLFSLGPDNTGRAIRRIFRPGFFNKVSRTSVISVYGFKTLLNGIVFPGPLIGKRNETTMRKTKAAGHEVGIHCWDHVKWQDELARLSVDDVRDEFAKARNEFGRIFGVESLTAGAAGWQADLKSLTVYDEADLLYASDCRGHSPFFAMVEERSFKTLQIPTTLPTLDELIGRSEYPDEKLTDHYLDMLKSQPLNVLTIHAELEGMAKIDWFRTFLSDAVRDGVVFDRLDSMANKLLKNPASIARHLVQEREIDGRSGTLATQGPRAEMPSSCLDH